VSHSLRGTGDSLHDDDSSCDRCHAGKRNVVILPIAEIADSTATRTHSSPKGAKTGIEYRPFLARLLPFPVCRAERHLLDNVRRVYLDSDIGNTDREDHRAILQEEHEQGDELFTRNRYSGNIETFKEETRSNGAGLSRIFWKKFARLR